MKYIRPLIPFLDDILVACALIIFVTASYMVNAVLGTYVLGIAFLVAAVFAGVWLKSPMAQLIISNIQRFKTQRQARKVQKGE